MAIPSKVGFNTYQIPVQNIPQIFDISLAGVNYTITCRWNDSADGGWILDIADQSTNTSLVANIPLITGADLLSGLSYLGINGEMWVYTDGDDFAVPSLTNLGVESNLYFLTTASVDG